MRTIHNGGPLLLVKLGLCSQLTAKVLNSVCMTTASSVSVLTSTSFTSCTHQVQDGTHTQGASPRLWRYPHCSLRLCGYRCRAPQSVRQSKSSGIGGRGGILLNNQGKPEAVAAAKQTAAYPCDKPGHLVAVESIALVIGADIDSRHFLRLRYRCCWC